MTAIVAVCSLAMFAMDATKPPPDASIPAAPQGGIQPVLAALEALDGLHNQHLLLLHVDVHTGEMVDDEELTFFEPHSLCVSAYKHIAEEAPESVAVPSDLYTEACDCIVEASFGWVDAIAWDNEAEKRLTARSRYFEGFLREIHGVREHRRILNSLVIAASTGQANITTPFYFFDYGDAMRNNVPKSMTLACDHYETLRNARGAY
ncbi:MAG: hypothetical protein AAGJ32_00565 [Pseudomonadota bacterium]